MSTAQVEQTTKEEQTKTIQKKKVKIILMGANTMS